MMVKKVKSIAEYAIRRWLLNQGFALEYFKLSIDGDKGYLEDQDGEMLVLVYDGMMKSVYIEEDGYQLGKAAKEGE